MIGQKKIKVAQNWLNKIHSTNENNLKIDIFKTQYYNRIKIIIKKSFLLIKRISYENIS
jgi:hypothetical protein